MRFKLEIVLGNEAMQTGFDVAAALENVARRLRSINQGDELTDLSEHASTTISDVNGHRVGNYKLTK